LGSELRREALQVDWLGRGRQHADFVASGAFDAAWYLSRYPDVQGPKGDAVNHYCSVGWKEGRFPNPLFDSRWYLAKYADVREAGENPLIHYLRHGAEEGREPNGWFDTKFWLAQAPSDAPAKNAMLDYLKSAPATRANPSSNLDLDAYAASYPELIAQGGDPLSHFLHNPDAVTHGWLAPCTSIWVGGWTARRVGPPVKLTISVNGEEVGEVTPWIERPDLENAIGFPGKGYFFVFPRRLSNGDTVRIRDENLVDLNGSPATYQIGPLNAGLGFLETRAAIAAMFLHGAGLEIGAFTQPTDLSPDLEIEYYDRFGVEALRKFYDESCCRPLFEPKYCGNAEWLDGLDPGKTFDFLIANHVIEHLEDPIRFLKEISRVLNPGGRFLLTAPNKRFSFDRRRELTRFDHLVDDHLGGVLRHRMSHYLDYTEKVDGVTGEALPAAAARLEAQGFSIHFHVWDENTFLEFLVTAIRKFYLPFQLLFTLSANGEISVVMERGQD